VACRTLTRPLSRVALALAAVASLHPTPMAQPSSPLNVLMVHWSSEDFPTNPAADLTIREVLSRSGLPVEYFAEYLESDRFAEGVATAALRDYIREKYRGIRIDVVLAHSAPALQFVTENRRELFPNAPVVFSAAELPDAGASGDTSRMTGIASGTGFHETLAMALQIHPSTERVFVVDESPLRATVKTELPDIEPRVQVVHVAEPVPQMIATIKAAPPDSLVLFVRHSQDAPGDLLRPTDVARLVATAAPVPVYGITEEIIGSGVVGGMVASVRSNSARMADMTVRLLEGADVGQIPIEQATEIPIFDWRQLRRWNIDPSRLPAGAVIRFREPTIWQLYRGYITAAIAVLAFQAVTIVALLVQRSRRREAQARNTAILRAIPDMMFLLNTNGVYVDYSVSEEDRLLLRPADFLGRHMREVLPAALAASFEDAIAKLGTQDRPVLVEYTLPMPGGDRYYEARMVACDRDRVLAVVRDITERKHSEHALSQTQADLARVSRLTALGEFAASIAHEVRQPLTAVLINAKACLRWIAGSKVDLSQVHAAIADIIDAGQRAEDVISRNRELFRDQTVQKVPIDLNLIVSETVLLVRQRLQVNRVALTTVLADDLPLVSADRVELQQVLLNLISNSIDAMGTVEAGSRQLVISTSAAPDEMLKVSVSDNGVGLDGVDMRRMFTISYTTKPRGTGVGLSVSRAIVEAHGGQLWAEPNDGAGATFLFTIPADSTPASHPSDLPR
jgi:PAS domain S-box-containing protein